MWKVSNRHPTSCYCWSDVVCLPLICKHLTRFLRVGAFVFIFNYILTNICSKTSFCFHLQSNERKWQKVNTGFLQYFKSKGVPKYIFDVIYLIRKKLEMFNPQTGVGKTRPTFTLWVFESECWPVCPVCFLTLLMSAWVGSRGCVLNTLVLHDLPDFYCITLSLLGSSFIQCQSLCVDAVWYKIRRFSFFFFVHWMFICNNIQKTFLHPKVTVAAE